MNFDFTEDQVMMRDSVRRTLEERPTPSQRKSADAESFDQALWKDFSELGLFSLLVPEEHEGMGLDMVDLVLCIEEFGRALATGCLIDTLAATDVVSRFGSSAQQSQCLPRLASGGMKVVLAIAETEAGFIPGDLASEAKPDGDDWVLSASKILVNSVEAADRILVALRLKGQQKLAFAILEPRTRGVSFRKHNTIDLSTGYYEVRFDNVRVSASELIVAEGDGCPVSRACDFLAAASAAEMIGAAARAMDMAVAYASERVQFGKPIGAFQAIKHKCADMLPSVETGKAAAYYAAWALANDSSDAARAVSSAKSFCGDAARSVCEQSVQVHGGMGFTFEYDLHFYLRRVKQLEYAFGDASWHRERVLDEFLRGRT